MSYTTRIASILAFVCCLTSIVMGQSRLDGTSFQVSTFNLPDSIGIVRLVDDTVEVPSDCRGDGPDGNDVPGEECAVFDSGIPSVEATFNAGPQEVGGLTLTPTAVPFAGLPEGESIVAFNVTTDVSAPLGTWSTPGDLIEFGMRTTNNTFPAGFDDDFWGFGATGIQYPNAAEDAHVGLPFDEELGNFVNTYFWFENAEGPILTGYEVGLPEAVGVGRHPTDPDREVLYPLYDRGQMDEQSDTPPGGSLDYFSHGSILNAVPQIGNLFVLADNTVGPDVDFDGITGFGIGVHVVPPEGGAPSLVGDFNTDGELTVADADLICSAVASGTTDGFDLTGDGAVNSDDVTAFLAAAGSLEGDADLSGTVNVQDFLALSRNFNQSGSWSSGDFDCNGTTQVQDFLALSRNFNQSAGTTAAAVPEPSSGLLVMIAGFAVGLLRRKRT